MGVVAVARMKMMSLRCLISLWLSVCYEIIFSVKALNKLSMRIANIPISWVSCEALSSPDTAGEDMDALLACAQNALDMLHLKRSVYGFSVK